MNQELIVPEVTEQQKQAWLNLAQTKNKVFTELQGKELALQGILLGEISDEELAKKIAEYKSEWKKLVEFRKEFTGKINSGLIEPAMLFEKRTDPDSNELVKQVVARELEYRKKQQEEINKQQNLNTEISNFDAHFRNEFAGIAQDYRQKLYNIITECYTHCLAARTPLSQTASAIAVAQAAMKEVQLLPVKNFNRVLISSDKAKELYAKIPKVNPGSILEESFQRLNDKFEMYANDLANAERAIRQEEIAHQNEVLASVAELRTEQAGNTLMASALAMTIPDPGFKGITETTRIVILDESPEWILNIITTFAKHFPRVFPFVKVKKYSQLKVEQMATALDAAGIQVPGVQYETIQK